MTLVLLFSCYIAHPAIAKHVLPIFTGNWYPIYNEAGVCSITHIDHDSCGLYHCHPEYTSQNEKDVAEYVFSDLPSYPDCKWTEARFGYRVHGITPIYTFPGDVDDWHEVNIIPGYWYKICVTPKGENIRDAHRFTYPVYECPPGSSFDFHDRDDKRKGCSDSPHLCKADVVGRNMQSLVDQNNNGFIGHIAAISSGPQIFPEQDNATVLEVLNKDPIIQENTLDNFQKASPVYWGARYELPDVPYVTDKQSDKIISAGENLVSKCYKYVQYSADPFNPPHLCQFDPTKGHETAILRCDYFVYQAYLVGANIKIFEFDPAGLPKRLWSTFLTCRDQACSGATNQKTKSEQAIKISDLDNRFNHLSWYLQEHRVEDIFAQTFFNPYDLEVYSYVKDAPTPSIEKQRFLWQLALKYQNDKDKFEYLIDAIIYLKPVELVDEIIAEYYRQTNVDIKLTLLSHIADLHSMQFNNVVVHKKVEDLFYDIALHEENTKILEKAVFEVPLPVEKRIVYIDEVLQRSDVGETLKKIMFASPSYYGSRMTMILYGGTEMQREYLKQFFDEVKERGNWHFLLDSLYNEFASFEPYCNYPGMIMPFNPAMLDDSVRPILSYFLAEHSPQAFTLEHNITREQKEEYYRWLRTYMAVQSKTLDESRKRVADYVRGISDLPYQALLLSTMGKTIYDTQFSIAELEKMLEPLAIRDRELWQALMWQNDITKVDRKLWIEHSYTSSAVSTLVDEIKRKKQGEDKLPVACERTGK